MKTIHFDSTWTSTDLCRIGAKYNTDKSPFSTESPCFQHRKGYTAFYHTLFASIRHKELNFCEIGIERGNSLQTFSEYFEFGKIYGFELLDEKIEHTRNLMLPRTTIIKTDVSDKNYLNYSFNQAGVLFDVIIDDSSHEKEHQKYIIEIASNYLKPGGILIIEDLFRNDPETVFDDLDLKMFSYETFVVCNHENRHNWDNDKIWYGIKR